MSKPTPFTEQDSQVHKPPIRAVTMTVFPQMESLRDVVDLSYSKLPITDQNELFTLFMIYHNTLLHRVRIEDSLWD